MRFKDFKGLSLSSLGLGTMRLPMKDGAIDQQLLNEMVDYAIEQGVNYFDTAVPYHEGLSEAAIGKALSRHARESWYLADKYPGHQISASYDPAATFESQLKKCGVEYFDFYLLHNVNDSSITTYLDERWGIVDYFVRQRELGRIKHLGFSCHSSLENLRKFLDAVGDRMEFCQIQLNYLDWSLQDAKGKYELLTERGLPVWVMEPARGGKLSRLSEADEARLRAYRSEESTSAWAFRFLKGLDNVTMVLSGMSNMEQMIDNVNTFSTDKPLSAEERALLLELAEGMKNSLPCTACRYCCDGCPAGLDIPGLISIYNDARFYWSINHSIQLGAIPADKLPSACIGCGQCAAMCPQQIDVPKAMADFAALCEKAPSWADICCQREEAEQRSLLEEQAENKT